MTKVNKGLDKIVEDIRMYWEENEKHLYDPAYHRYAKRSFTKYYVANIAKFYKMRDLKYL